MAPDFDPTFAIAPRRRHARLPTRLLETPMPYENILVERRGKAALVTLNRPKALNALSAGLVADLNHALADFEADAGVGAVVVTGSEKAFCAGADLKEVSGIDFIAAYRENLISEWDRIAGFRKPLIAAVAGYALGGGCELAMMCDIILAADTAKFGQPEITLGIIPGAGGTQRLARLIGKAKAMEMCLTGRLIGAEEAERAGLVSRIIPAAGLVEEAMKVAEKIASFPLAATMMVKESVNRAEETSLAEGLRFERRLFHALFASEDQKEGMAAFLEKRAPQFRGR
jgi:enoyl-CoA hydratase